MSRPTTLRSRSGQASIIGMIAVTVIILILVYVLMTRSSGGRREPLVGKSPSAPIQQAKGVDCANNLQQLRSALSMYSQSNEQPPATLNDLANQSGSTLPRSIFQCPVSKQPYSYDPAQGKIWCTTPGHERY